MLIHQILLKITYQANLKSNVDKLDVDKLKNVPTALKSLERKIDKLKKRVAERDVYNAKITNIEDKITDATNLPNNTGLTAVKNIITNTSNLVKRLPITQKLIWKLNYFENEKRIINLDHDKYILLKKLALEDFAASKYDIANFVNKTDFDVN